MTRRLLLALTALALCAAPARATVHDVPAATVVAVEGNARDGFAIHRLDGSSSFPPTRSEARAECLEYDVHVDVVHCRTEVRVWYRDLADLKVALRYAQAQP